MTLPPLVTVLAVSALALVPLVVLLAARRGEPESPRLSAGRFFLLYALLFSLLLLAARAEGLPTSLGLLGIVLALLGLGAGVESLYRYLYGAPWLAEHPGIVRRDVERWQRATLVAAVAALALAVVLALYATDLALAP